MNLLEFEALLQEHFYIKDLKMLIATDVRVHYNALDKKIWLFL